MPQRNVNLTEHFDKFIDANLASGRFSNASEIVREGLRLLEVRSKEEDARLVWLKTAATDAFASLDRGEGFRFESMDELDAFILETSEEVFAGAVPQLK